MSTNYINLKPGSVPADITALAPFLAILVIEEKAEPGWRDAVSHWLIKSGCQNLLSWGMDHKDWDEAVDLANIAQFNDGEIPEDELVLTSEKDAETLYEFFKEAKNIIAQECTDFPNTVIVHVSGEEKEQDFLSMLSGGD